METAPCYQGETDCGLDQHFEVLKELGDCYAAMDEHERARQYYLQAASMAPEQPAPYVGLGVIDLQTGRLDDARRAFKLACQMDPRCAEAYGGLAMIYQQAEDYPAALEMYLRCLELDTENLVALLGLFQTSCQMGSFAKIIHYLRVYLDRHPGDTSVLFCLASLYAKQGELAQARELVLDVLALEPDKAEAASLLAQIRDSLARSVPA